MDKQMMQAVNEAVAKKKFLKIQYRTDLNEFLTVTALIKKVEETGNGLKVELATGEEIPFDQLVKVGDVASNQFTSRDFTCDC
ncbi:hypothetical protein ACFSC6_16710 [Rufibacter sediminis]|uniref:Uncharacterized protein n=1 Tax=Rufibacter sediminis TaxID=2762756 RepID=A0ABR6VT86_9BACT|nr:hypothetical protein [Rufibacter sediminis]MBC3540144.1 hypothetical protein [Rufibacter sediminis]